MRNGTYMCKHHYEEWAAKQRRHRWERRILSTIVFVASFVLSSLLIQWLTGEWLF